jgi:Na+-driven multidrug efflux pump
MTATGSIGLVAVFAVDFLSLFWVARLGSQKLKVTVGYASQLQFVALSVSIGLTIAISATASRALYVTRVWSDFAATALAFAIVARLANAIRPK